MKSRVDSSVDGLIESRGLSSSKRHGSDGSLVRGLSGGEELSSGGGSLLGGRLSGVENTSREERRGRRNQSLEGRKEGEKERNSPVDDVRHRSRSVRSEDLDGDNASLLSDTVLPRSDGSSAVSSYECKEEVQLEEARRTRRSRERRELNEPCPFPSLSTSFLGIVFPQEARPSNST